MKKLKNFTCLCALILMQNAFSFGQSAQTPEKGHHAPSVTTVTCGTDTIEYPLTKTTVIDKLTLRKGNFEGVSQWFELSDAATISGISFWARVKTNGVTNKTANLTVRLYNSTTDSLPTGVAVATGTISVDTVWKKRNASFITSANLTNHYLVAIEYGALLTDNDTIEIGVNSPGDGQGEKLGSVFWNTGSATVWVSFATKLPSPDRDALIYPWVNYSLTSDFSLPQDTICQNEMEAFSNGSSFFSGNRMYNLRVADPGTFGDAFSWSFGDAGSSTNMNPMHSYASTGSFTVVLTTAIRGYYTTCSEPSVKTQLVRTRPAASFSIAPGTAIIGDTVSINNSSTGVIDMCIWDYGDGRIDTLCGDHQIVYDSAGTYTIKLTIHSAYGCEETFTQNITISTMTSLNENLNKGKYKVYPNPFEDQLNVEAGHHPVGKVFMRVCDLRGKVLIQITQDGGNAGQTNLNLNSLQPGMYVMQIIDDEGVFTYRVFKSH